MLLELHVKNLALIETADVELEDGLNILTGETGAGKSIMIGSVNLALGQNASKEMIRNGAEYAYVELVFSVDPEKEDALRALDVMPDENGTLIISRKIMPSRSLSRINDEDSVNSIAQMIDNPDTNIRIEAAKALGSIGTEYAKTYLLHRLNAEQDETVKTAIKEALHTLAEHH